MNLKFGEKTMMCKTISKTKLRLAAGLMSWVLLIGSGVLSAVADSAQDQAHKAIQANYVKRDAAASRKDANAYWSYRTDNFIWISKNGKRKTAKQLKPETVKMFNAAESLNGRAVIQKLTVKGDTATVLVKDSGTIVIPVSKTRKNVIKIAETASDTWVKRNGKWLQSQSKTLTAVLTVNGKTVKY